MKYVDYALFSLWGMLLPQAAFADNEALRLSAADRSYVSVPCFQTPAEMTVEAWLKTAQGGTGTIVAWKDVGADGESSMFRVQNGRLQYGEWYAGSWSEINSAQTVNNDLWCHVAIVRKGHEAKLYINGVLSATASMNASAFCTTDDLKIGALGTTWSECYDGLLDEVRIWSRARSVDEIANDCNRSLTGAEPGLEGYWTFDGNLTDMTAHARNGQANNVSYVPSDIFNASAPEVSAVTFVERVSSLPAVHVKVSRSGRIRWGMRLATDVPPSADDLLNATGMVAAGGGEAATQGAHSFLLEDSLKRGSAYVPYALLVATGGAVSEVKAGATFTYEGLSCLPLGWTACEVGTATGGSATAADGAFTVAGSGTDIWNAADGFHYAYTASADDVQITARVASLTAADDWAKAGLMLRGTAAADARHVFICTTPGQGNNSFTRLSDGRTTTVSTISPAQPWLRLVKKGKWVATYVSADGLQWTKVGVSAELLGGQTFSKIGLAVCGHGSGVATAVFDHVSIETPADTVDLCDRGVYFDKKAYVPTPIPQYADIAGRLPRPVLTDNPDWVKMYYKAWEIGFGHIKAPAAGSPLVSNFYDEAFDSHIFQWDMLFMTIFGRYAAHVFPGVESLDNFYCRQHESGCITRCLTEDTGEDNGDEDSDNIINPPLFAWAEMQNYRFTADKQRLRRVFPVLTKYEAFVDLKRNCNDTPHKLYWNNGQASGMDNLPRDTGRENLHHASDHQGWADMSSQVIIQCENLSEMATILAADETDAARRRYYLAQADYYTEKARTIGQRMNAWLWNADEGIYYDVDTLGVQTGWKTAACFWPLLAGVTDAAKDSCLVRHLQNPASFWRDNVFPALAADEEGYSPRGGYWCGGVWAPANYAIIKGLERKGIDAFAHLAAMRYINAVHDVFLQTGTFWENYAPEKKADGRYNHGTDESDYYACRKDFIGWTGLAPISLLIENVIGLRADAPANKLVFDLRRLDLHGIERLRFGDITTTVMAGARASSADAVEINVESDRPYLLIVVRDEQTDTLQVVPGKQVFALSGLLTGLSAPHATVAGGAFVYDSANRHLVVGTTECPVRVDVYSLDCTRVESANFASQQTPAQLSLNHCRPGIYVVNLTAGRQTYSKKIAIE